MHKGKQQKKEISRASLRNATEAAVVCSPFTSNRTTHTTCAVIRNFSKEGSYIETSCKFKSGTILHLRMVDFPSLPPSLKTEDLPRSIFLAEVKWWKELVDEGIMHYGLGLKYLV
jgi:hypothetical protein